MKAETKKILVEKSLFPLVETENCLLGRSGLKVFTAEDGAEMLDLHRRERVNLIIASLNMPGLSGDEMCSAIRAEDELKKVGIILVCSRRPEDLNRCAKCGANNYLARPISRNELKEGISKLLDVSCRRDLRVLIKVSVKGHFRSEPFFGTSENISRTGLLIEADRALAKGDVIHCSFFIPEEERVLSDCEVVRVVKKEAKYFYGVRFINIDNPSGAAIERFVKKKLSEY